MDNRSQRVPGAIGWAVLAVAYFLWQAPGFEFFALGGDIDHGYQIALGQQVFHGAVPGVDFFTQYGPAIGWLSALSWSTGHVWLFEVLSWSLFLGAGYSLLWWWIGDDAHPGRKVCVLLPAFLVAPFYAKYYFAFFPALFLVQLGDGTADVTPARSPWRWYFAGVTAGAAGLFRLELGVALAFAGAVYLGWDDARTPRLPRAALRLLAGAATVTGGLCLYLAVGARDWTAPYDFLDFEWAAIIGKMDAFGRNEAALNGPFQRGAAGFWSLVVLAILYAGVVLFGRRPDIRRSYPPRIWAAALVGGALLPQVMHNTGVAYALQAGLPACGLVAMYVLANWETHRNRAGLLLGLYLAIGSGWQLGQAYSGYRGWNIPLLAKLGSLAHEVAPAQAANNGPALAAAIEHLTNTDDRILILSLDSRFYALAHRPWAGLIPHLAIPLPERWQQRCVAELRRNRPALVLTTDLTIDPPSSLNYRGRNPVIEAFIRQHYTVLVRSFDGWVLLGPRPGW